MNQELSSRQLKTIDLLNIDIKRTTGRGWMTGINCPVCGRADKFGVKFNHESNRKNHVSLNCFHGSCNFKGTEFTLFKHFNKLHLLYEGEFIGSKEIVNTQLKMLEEVMPDINVPDRYPPFGFKRTYESVYLNSRGYTPQCYQNSVIGFTKLDMILCNYVIFLCYESGTNKGYVSRLTWNSEQIDNYTQRTGKVPAKYLNEAVEFSKMLYGIDDITENTKEVILVEGITDKHNVDRLLNLHQSEEIKCLACFGKKVSREQIIKLWNFGQNIAKIILFFDANTVNSCKLYSRELSLWFPEIKIAYLDNEDIDPGNIKLDHLKEVLSNLHSPDQYDVNFVQIKRLE